MSLMTVHCLKYLFWEVGVDYQENDLVIKDGIVCKYWRYPKTGELVWLSADNCHQYDMFIMHNKE